MAATTLVRWLVAAVLLVAGVAKLRSLRAFAQAVDEYRLLPQPLGRCVAYLLPWVESGVGLALFLGWYTVLAATTAVALLASFAIAVGVNLIRGRKVPCNCFGVSHRKNIGTGALVRQASLLAGAAWIAWRGPGPVTLEAWLTTSGVENAEYQLALAIAALAITLAAALAAESMHLRDRIAKREGGRRSTAREWH